MYIPPIPAIRMLRLFPSRLRSIGGTRFPRSTTTDRPRRRKCGAKPPVAAQLPDLQRWRPKAVGRLTWPAVETEDPR
jgi:hypothetical protein